ncbi:MAG: hypothetical protein SFT92_01230 [Rickettsiales bacterium]|nr:hypothetical protein [Rickettsiales bacterium]
MADNELKPISADQISFHAQSGGAELDVARVGTNRKESVATVRINFDSPAEATAHLAAVNKVAAPSARVPANQSYIEISEKDANRLQLIEPKGSSKGYKEYHVKDHGLNLINERVATLPPVRTTVAPDVAAPVPYPGDSDPIPLARAQTKPGTPAVDPEAGFAEMIARDGREPVDGPPIELMRRDKGQSSTPTPERKTFGQWLKGLLPGGGEKPAADAPTVTPDAPEAAPKKPGFFSRLFSRTEKTAVEVDTVLGAEEAVEESKPKRRGLGQWLKDTFGSKPEAAKGPVTVSSQDIAIYDENNKPVNDGAQLSPEELAGKKVGITVANEAIANGMAEDIRSRGHAALGGAEVARTLDGRTVVMMDAEIAIGNDENSYVRRLNNGLLTAGDRLNNHLQEATGKHYAAPLLAREGVAGVESTPPTLSIKGKNLRIEASGVTYNEQWQDNGLTRPMADEVYAHNMAKVLNERGIGAKAVNDPEKGWGVELPIKEAEQNGLIQRGKKGEPITVRENFLQLQDDTHNRTLDNRQKYTLEAGSGEKGKARAEAYAKEFNKGAGKDISTVREHPERGWVVETAHVDLDAARAKGFDIGAAIDSVRKPSIIERASRSVPSLPDVSLPKLSMPKVSFSTFGLPNVDRFINWARGNKAATPVADTTPVAADVEVETTPKAPKRSMFTGLREAISNGAKRLGSAFGLGPTTFDSEVDRAVKAEEKGLKQLRKNVNLDADGQISGPDEFGIAKAEERIEKLKELKNRTFDSPEAALAALDEASPSRPKSNRPVRLGDKNTAKASIVSTTVEASDARPATVADVTPAVAAAEVAKPPVARDTTALMADSIIQDLPPLKGTFNGKPITSERIGIVVDSPEMAHALADQLRGEYNQALEVQVERINGKDIVTMDRANATVGKSAPLKTGADGKIIIPDTVQALYENARVQDAKITTRSIIDGSDTTFSKDSIIHDLPPVKGTFNGMPITSERIGIVVDSPEMAHALADQLRGEYNQALDVKVERVGRRDVVTMDRNNAILGKNAPLKQTADGLAISDTTHSLYENAREVAPVAKPAVVDTATKAPAVASAEPEKTSGLGVEPDAPAARGSAAGIGVRERVAGWLKRMSLPTVAALIAEKPKAPEAKAPKAPKGKAAVAAVADVDTPKAKEATPAVETDASKPASPAVDAPIRDFNIGEAAEAHIAEAKAKGKPVRFPFHGLEFEVTPDSTREGVAQEHATRLNGPKTHPAGAGHPDYTGPAPVLSDGTTYNAPESLRPRSAAHVSSPDAPSHVGGEAHVNHGSMAAQGRIGTAGGAIFTVISYNQLIKHAREGKLFQSSEDLSHLGGAIAGTADLADNALPLFTRGTNPSALSSKLGAVGGSAGVVLGGFSAYNGASMLLDNDSSNDVSGWTQLGVGGASTVGSTAMVMKSMGSTSAFATKGGGAMMRFGMVTGAVESGMAIYEAKQKGDDFLVYKESLTGVLQTGGNYVPFVGDALREVARGTDALASWFGGTGLQSDIKQSAIVTAGQELVAPAFQAATDRWYGTSEHAATEQRDKTHAMLLDKLVEFHKASEQNPSDPEARAKAANAATLIDARMQRDPVFRNLVMNGEQKNQIGHILEQYKPEIETARAQANEKAKIVKMPDKNKRADWSPQEVTQYMLATLDERSRELEKMVKEGKSGNELEDQRKLVAQSAETVARRLEKHPAEYHPESAAARALNAQKDPAHAVWPHGTGPKPADAVPATTVRPADGSLSTDTSRTGAGTPVVVTDGAGTIGSGTPVIVADGAGTIGSGTPVIVTDGAGTIGSGTPVSVTPSKDPDAGAQHITIDAAAEARIRQHQINFHARLEEISRLWEETSKGGTEKDNFVRLTQVAPKMQALFKDMQEAGVSKDDANALLAYATHAKDKTHTHATGGQLDYDDVVIAINPTSNFSAGSPEAEKALKDRMMATNDFNIAGKMTHDQFIDVLRKNNIEPDELSPRVLARLERAARHYPADPATGPGSYDQVLQNFNNTMNDANAISSLSQRAATQQGFRYDEGSLNQDFTELKKAMQTPVVSGGSGPQRGGEPTR